MNKPKEFITLRFSEPGEVNAYRVRNVPILKKLSICGIEGFAAHRKFYTHDGRPVPKQVRVSHIETGTTVADGESLDKAIKNAIELCCVKGGAKAIKTAVSKLKRTLKKRKLIV